MIYVILGKTASGKTTIVDYISKEKWINRIVTYTSRPMRKKEKNDETYHFVTKEEFEGLIQSGFFCRVEVLRHGRWCLVLWIISG